MEERWALVAKFPDYEVSDAGRVRRVTSRTCAKAGSILKASPRSRTHPYLVVDLCCEGKRKTSAVHRLVAEAFLGAQPFPGAEVNHLNGDKSDPRASNLEWTTASGNRVHAYKAGLRDARGEKNGQAKLTAELVVGLRSQGAMTVAERAAAAAGLGVSETAVRDALSRRTWAHI